MLVSDLAKQFRLHRGEQLRALERVERYRMLVEGVQDYAIFMLDMDGTIVTWNNGAKVLKGYSASEAIGRHFSMFYPEHVKTEQLPKKLLAEAAANGSVEDNGWRVRKDGTTFWANVVITALYDNDGTVTGFAKVTKDLTERKKHEEELLKANEELRTQRAQLEELNAIKDEFVSLVSHQLRAPATGVKQYLGLLLEGYVGELTDEQKSHIKHAYDSNERQLEMVEDLLHVAQVDSGKMNLVKQQVDIVDLVKDVVCEHHSVFKSRNQTFTAPLQSSLTLEADKPRLRMVVENLIDNASKYTPGGGTISVAFESDDVQSKIHITDSGVGISKESLPQLFKKFSRIRNELSTTVDGNGLGLYWAQKVIELHGGTIAVDSTPGQGSTFTVSLPNN